MNCPTVIASMCFTIPQDILRTNQCLDECMHGRMAGRKEGMMDGFMVGCTYVGTYN